jgi:hypothetical protein
MSKYTVVPATNPVDGAHVYRGTECVLITQLRTADPKEHTAFAEQVAKLLNAAEETQGLAVICIALAAIVAAIRTTDPEHLGDRVAKLLDALADAPAT